MATVRTMKKLMLGREIAHMIAVAGMTQAEAAEIIETSQSRIAGLINGQGNITVGDLERLASRLGFTDPGHLAALLELRRDNHKRGFWTSGHNRAYTEELRLLVDLEHHADELRTYEVEIMPGLVQCEAYVRAVHAEVPDQDGVTLDDRVQARLARQDVYDRPEPPAVHFVLSESCLRRVWGDEQVMREQVDYLLALSERPAVLVQVLPFRSPLGRSTLIGHRFTLLRVPSPGVAGPLELAYTEGHGEIRYIDDKKALAAHRNAWTRLSVAALSVEESRAFIRKIARDFR
ncbi:MAG: Scr1 family TA system antitoxin-like transcriptional regulator [Pseudonocardia sp.]